MTKRTVATATRKRADRLASHLRGTEVEQRAAELAEWARQSEALAKAQAKAEALAKAQAKAEALAAKAQANAEKLAAKTQAKAERLAARMQRKGTELAAKAQTRGSELTEQVGEQLSGGRTGKLLGIRQRRPAPVWFVIFGVAGGCVVGVLIARKCRGQATTPLAETIRSELASDPRTAQLPNLEVNVAGGTVFVRGTVPPGFHEDALRDVITRVPGVHDVDLQVTAA
jgi:hypothetical protein